MNLNEFLQRKPFLGNKDLFPNIINHKFYFTASFNAKEYIYVIYDNDKIKPELIPKYTSNKYIKENVKVIFDVSHIRREESFYVINDLLFLTNNRMIFGNDEFNYIQRIRYCSSFAEDKPMFKVNKPVTDHDFTKKCLFEDWVNEWKNINFDTKVNGIIFRYKYHTYEEGPFSFGYYKYLLPQYYFSLVKLGKEHLLCRYDKKFLIPLNYLFDKVSKNYKKREKMSKDEALKRVEENIKKLNIGKPGVKKIEIIDEDIDEENNTIIQENITKYTNPIYNKVVIINNLDKNSLIKGLYSDLIKNEKEIVGKVARYFFHTNELHISNKFLETDIQDSNNVLHSFLSYKGTQRDFIERTDISKLYGVIKIEKNKDFELNSEAKLWAYKNLPWANEQSLKKFLITCKASISKENYGVISEIPHGKNKEKEINVLKNKHNRIINFEYQYFNWYKKDVNIKKLKDYYDNEPYSIKIYNSWYSKIMMMINCKQILLKNNYTFQNSCKISTRDKLEDYIKLPNEHERLFKVADNSWFINTLNYGTIAENNSSSPLFSFRLNINGIKEAERENYGENENTPIAYAYSIPINDGKYSINIINNKSLYKLYIVLLKRRTKNR